MASTKEGGRKAAATNKLREPGFYARIGAKGGRNGNTGGFADRSPCRCTTIDGSHFQPQCAGKRGGSKSRKRAI